jgi:hypothetical protein
VTALGDDKDFAKDKTAGQKLVTSQSHAVYEGLSRRTEDVMPFEVVNPEHGIKIEL